MSAVVNLLVSLETWIGHALLAAGRGTVWAAGMLAAALAWRPQHAR